MTEGEKEIIASTPITMDCFEMDDFDNLISSEFDTWSHIINDCEKLRKRYNETKDKRYWKELIRLLPNSYKVVKIMD